MSDLVPQMPAELQDNQIRLDAFIPRWYQREVFQALEIKKMRRLILVWSRRSGKDICTWMLAIRQCIMKVCVVYYALPTFALAKRVIWEGIAIDGKSYLSFIPKELIISTNSVELSIRFINGSILRLIGANSYDNVIIGTNIYGLVISEAAKVEQIDDLLDFFRPIIALNGGWVLLQSTPRGRRTLYHVWNRAKELGDWYLSFLTAYDTKHIPHDILEKEKLQMSPDLFAQEYLCDWNKGNDGIVYGKYIDKMHLDGRYTIVNPDPTLLTHIVMDIGQTKDNTTCIIFFQVPDDQGVIKIIDYYSAYDQGLDTYAKIIQDKVNENNLIIGKMFAPHDMEVREFSNSMSRTIRARGMGMEWHVLKQHLIEDGIDTVMAIFSKLWIDERHCKSLMDSLENYMRIWDDERRIYKEPIHNWASNGADSLRYMAASLQHLQQKRSLEEINNVRRQALYGGKSRPLPAQFIKY